ncbi:MAG: hypothetical protein L0Y58_08540 [Verrucomicrobia subdivision 3 bacterium]|nr:hypothetical protein [Limisphaerales bacterium]
MTHPIEYLSRVTDFLDLLIRVYGDYLFMGFAYLCLFLLAWIFLRRRKRPVHDFPVMILPLDTGRRREPEPQPSLFETHSDL